ncbi:MAG: NTP transferase domain-containing protein [Candidatus Omnitrophica bacterium]|nr:NTP transferase domain-containing protein [Candidatus Omnitrophota bacterium]MDD5488195.1 NTP transferase domain-containing protein [Candidatus Omnitrophota bacterium]
MKKTIAIVLAAGLGTRMNSDLPKVLHKVGARSILSRIVDSLKEAGIEDILIVVGFGAEAVKKEFSGQARFVHQVELLGSGDALKAAAGEIEASGAEKVVVACGDTPLISSATYRELRDMSEASGASCAVLTAEVGDPTGYGRIVRNGTGHVVRIVEEKDAGPAEKDIKEINSGTYCFGVEDLLRFIGEIKRNEKKKEFYLTDIVDILVSKGRKVVAGTCTEREIAGVNSRKDIAAVNKVINDKKINELMASGVTITDPGTTSIDETAVIGRDTVIYPNTVIEKDVRIGGRCSIGPFARLRPGTDVSDNVEIGNFVEICRTSIASGTKVKHHTYLGDTRVGSDVNIGAGTITANYDGGKKNITEIGDGAFIGVGAILIAPVKVGAGSIVGAGSVVTKGRNVAPGETVAGVPARKLKTEKGA